MLRVNIDRTVMAGEIARKEAEVTNSADAGTGSDAVRTPRRYRQLRRAELEAQTRLRITEAAMKLHGTVGPLRTTVTAVAEEAGVQRGTVYRHFPDEDALFGACSMHWMSLNPTPSPDAWVGIDDPSQRLRRALVELYHWYERNQRMLDNVFRDAPLVSALKPPVESFQRQLSAMHATLMRGRPQRGRARPRRRRGRTRDWVRGLELVGPRERTRQRRSCRLDGSDGCRSWRAVARSDEGVTY